VVQPVALSYPGSSKDKKLITIQFDGPYLIMFSSSTDSGICQISNFHTVTMFVTVNM
jgi:hypothetical protein